jgi:2-polyprenyl-3-methyl-5-hydroxy-6-metoxy-1,4-benzoquinol methylase
MPGDESVRRPAVMVSVPRHVPCPFSSSAAARKVNRLACGEETRQPGTLRARPQRDRNHRMQRTQTYDAKGYYRGPRAAQYEKRRAQDRQWHRENACMARMLGGLPFRQNLADVPFGTGRFADLYVRRQHEVIGIDISQDMLRASFTLSAVSELGPNLVVGDAERLPLRDGSVDFIVCTRLFNWLPPDVRTIVLTEFSRIAVGGVLLQLRVRERPSRAAFGVRMLREIGRDPVGAVTGRARGLARRARPVARSVLGHLWPGPAEGSDDSALPRGYSVPDNEAVSDLLAAAGLAVRQRVTVHANFDVRHRTIYEMRLYHLHHVS